MDVGVLVHRQGFLRLRFAVRLCFLLLVILFIAYFAAFALDYGFGFVLDELLANYFALVFYFFLNCLNSRIFTAIVLALSNFLKQFYILLQFYNAGCCFVFWNLIHSFDFGLFPRNRVPAIGSFREFFCSLVEAEHVLGRENNLSAVFDAVLDDGFRGNVEFCKNWTDGVEFDVVVVRE